MRKLLFLLLSIFAGVAATANSKEELRLDTSSESNMQKSFAKMLMALDDDDQQAFAGAMATIAVVLSNNPNAADGKSLEELISGKTANEIIAASRRLASFIKQNTNIINGSSANEFGKSVGEILVSLEPEKQSLFSEAIAKVMYEAQKKGEDENSVMKQLDGKTADEVINLAKKIDLPFSISNKTNPQDYQVRQLSDEEVKKLNLEEEPEDKYTPSLVPVPKPKAQPANQL